MKGVIIYLRKSTSIICNHLREILFFTILGLILLVSNHNITLFDQDEAAYAGFGKYFLENPNAHIPQFLWSEPHRKTPLHFWLIAFSYKIFGINEFAVRFPSALALFFSYILCFLKTKKHFSLRIAFLVTIMLGTSFFIPFMAKMALTDALLFLWSSTCGWSVIDMVQDKGRSLPWQRPTLILLFWAAFALAILTKGPPIFIFTGIFAILIFAFYPQRFRLFRFHPWFFLPLALLPIGYWAYLTTKEDGGEFLKWFVDWYILKRVNSYVFGQTGPPGYYLLSFVGFFLPYLPFLFPALWNIFQYFASGVLSYFPEKIKNFFLHGKKEMGIHFLLAAWFVAAWFIYEILPSKLPSYALAAYMPLAVMMAISADKMMSRLEKKGIILAYIHTTLMLLLGLALLFSFLWIKLPNSSVIFLGITGFMTVIGALIAFYYWKMEKYDRYIYVLCTNATLFLLLVWAFVVPSLDNMRNGTKQVANYLAANLPSDIPIFIANSEGNPPSLPFYLSLHFEHISETQDVINTYKSAVRVAFILNETQYMALRQTEVPKDAQFFSTYRTDRGRKSAYWVVVK